MDIFSESGTEGLTMKAIADRVEISEPAIYRHFKNKQAIIISMITQIRDELFKRVDEIIRRPLTSVEKLYYIFGHHLFFLKEKRGITVALLSESFFHNHPEARRRMLFMLNDYHQRICEIISLGIEKGEIPERINPEAASILFLGSLQHLLTIFKLTNDEKAIDLLAEDVFNLFRNALEGGASS